MYAYDTYQCIAYASVAYIMKDLPTCLHELSTTSCHSQNEIMTGTIDESNAIISRITLGLYEDSG